MRVLVCPQQQKRHPNGCLFAVRTRLELATYGVTGRYSNQLNYRTGWLLFSKAGAKVLLFFDMTKFLGNFFSKKCIFLKKAL